MRGFDCVWRCGRAAFEKQVLQARKVLPVDFEQKQLEIGPELVFVYEQLSVAGHAAVQVDFAYNLLDYFYGEHELVLKVRLEQAYARPEGFHQYSEHIGIATIR